MSDIFERLKIEQELLECNLMTDLMEVCKGDLEHLICDCGHSNELIQPFYKVICEKCGINIGEIVNARTTKVFNRYFRELF